MKFRVKIFMVAAGAVAASVHVAFAAKWEAVAEAPLPAAFGDGETAREIDVPDRDALMPGARTVRLTFTVANAAATNSAVVSAGVPGLDGRQMSLASTRVALAYDGARAEWQLRHDGFRQRLAAPLAGPPSAGARSLVATVLVSTSSGVPQSVRFSDGGSPVTFGGMAATNAALRSLFDFSGLDSLRVASRNGAEASVKLEMAEDGTVMILR